MIEGQPASTAVLGSMWAFGVEERMVCTEIERQNSQSHLSVALKASAFCFGFYLLSTQNSSETSHCHLLYLEIN